MGTTRFRSTQAKSRSNSVGSASTAFELIGLEELPRGRHPPGFVFRENSYGEKFN